MSVRTARESPGLSVSVRRGSRWSARLTPSGLAVAAFTTLVAGLYVTFELFRFYTLQSTSYDLVIFDQAVRSYAHFAPGISIIKGVHNGFGPHFSVLGDHWSPILAALAPLYWIYNGPQVLLVAQGALFALAIPPIWLFTRRAFGGGHRATAAAYLVSAVYALSWPIATALGHDFHEVAFAPVLTAVALERLQAGKVRSALLALAALLLVKEDMGLLVAGLGCYLAVSRQHLTRQRLLAAVLIVIGVADTALATYVLIPAFGGRATYYWAYDALGRNVPQLLWHLVAHPIGSLHQLVTPRVKLDTMLWLLAAFCFLPLLSPISIAAVPLLLERMLSSTFPNWWVTSFHYNAYLVVILLCGAVDGAARLGRWAEAARNHRPARTVRVGSQAAAGIPAGTAAASAPSAAMAAGRTATPSSRSLAAAGSASRTASRAEGSIRSASVRAGRAWVPPAAAPNAVPGMGAGIATGEGVRASGLAAAIVRPAGPYGRMTPGWHCWRGAVTLPAEALDGGVRGWRSAMPFRVGGRPFLAARRPSRLPSTIALGAAAAMLAVAALLVPRFDFGSALHGGFYRLSQGEQAAVAAVTVVPAGVVVEAANKVGPQLSGADTVLLWDGEHGTPPLAAPWVIANVSQRQFTFNNIGEQRQRVLLLQRAGYKIVFQRDGYIVLHRSG